MITYNYIRMLSSVTEFSKEEYPKLFTVLKPATIEFRTCKGSDQLEALVEPKELVTHEVLNL